MVRGILLLNLFITAFAYLLVPVIFSLIGKEMSQKQIKKVIIINGAIVWLIFRIIILNSGGDSAGGAVFLWSGIAYYIMKKKCMVNKTDVSENILHNSRIDDGSYSLSDGQDIAPIGNYNVRGNDIALAPITEHDYNNYAEHCEQYRQSVNNKPKRTNIPLAAILSVIVLMSLTINIGLIAAYFSQKDKLETLKESNSKLRVTNISLETELAECEKKYSILERAKITIQDKANFMNEHIVFVLDGYGDYYYTYDQMQFITQGVDEFEYWAYNKEQAIYLGYKAWK